jgi:DNA helicase II / ATP-dependent DNA helicase PcrA
MPDEARRDFLLRGLNERQRQAVQHQTGPLLVVAGAGSGKTRMLTHRIAWLIEIEEVPPEEILAVTFTNKAAREMRERVARLVPEAGEKVTLATFHSWCCLHLRRWHAQAGFPDGFTIFDEDDAEKVMKEVVAGMGLDDKQLSPRFFLNLVSQAKNELLEPEEFTPPHRPDLVKLAYSRYQQALRTQSAVDFDDLIFLTWKMFHTHADLLERIQHRFRYFLVDEYQDTNHAQYRLIALLSSDSRNLCVVGDEDQSIYSWRGASIRNIRDFTTDFPGAEVICLDQNYRSTQTILDAAGAVIANNASSFKKRLWTDNAAGDLVHFHLAMDERAEADWIAKQITTWRRTTGRLGDCAVLFRMNSLSRPIEQALGRMRVPYEVTGGQKFFQRREVKDILAYLRVLHNQADEVALKRIINVPRRGIGNSSVAKMAAGHGLWAGLQAEAGERPKGKAAGFAAFLNELRIDGPTRVSALARQIIDRTEYRAWLRTSEPDTVEEREANIDSLIADMRVQEEENPELTLREYLEDTALHADIDDLVEGDDKVHLMTLHNAKGLEFPLVFLMAMEEGIFPHASAKNAPEELEEERRLAYVGMTRAQRRLHLSAARRRMLFGAWNTTMLSRFVLEIPRDLFIPGSLPGGTTRAQETPRFGGERPAPPPAYEDHHQFSAPSPRATVSGLRGPYRPQQEPERPRPPIVHTPPLPAVATGARAVGEAATMMNVGRGAKVRHQTFGEGRILAIDGSSLQDFRLTIDFEKVGRKTLLLQYAQLRVINS